MICQYLHLEVTRGGIRTNHTTAFMVLAVAFAAGFAVTTWTIVLFIC